MTERTTSYGRLCVGTRDELFGRAASLATEQFAATPGPARFTWALTGGSTPGEWYRWVVQSKALPAELLGRTLFTVSDERYVPLSSDQSNLGNAQRQLLEPLNVPAALHRPWPTDLPPAEAAQAYARSWAGEFGPARAYDLCFAGMGDDAHTLSLFPGSPLLARPSSRLFEAIEVPGKGWRLTLTTAGLAACGRIVVMTLGAGKAPALERVFKGTYDPLNAPSQILRDCADRVYWLVDTAAASRL